MTYIPYCPCAALVQPSHLSTEQAEKSAQLDKLPHYSAGPKEKSQPNKILLIKVRNEEKLINHLQRLPSYGITLQKKKKYYWQREKGEMRKGDIYA